MGATAPLRSRAAVSLRNSYLLEIALAYIDKLTMAGSFRLPYVAQVIISNNKVDLEVNESAGGRSGPIAPSFGRRTSSSHVEEPDEKSEVSNARGESLAPRLGH